jgi:uncharacterized protein YbaP (TraB family)
MRKQLLIHALLLLCAGSCFAQDTLITNALLWRVSGKGLKSPSYLYGTIHLSDPRLFRFTDSFYRAFDSTQAYAMEVEPELLQLSMSSFMADTANTPALRTDISEADFWDIGYTMGQKLGVPMQTLHRKHAWIYERFILRDKRRPDDMRYNMDFHLYRIARSQGWWTGGIEQVDDHMSVTLAEYAAYRPNAKRIKKAQAATIIPVEEELKEAYLREDLAAIYQMDLRTRDSAWREFALLRRNRTMTRSIDSLARLRPTFFAFGCGHLSGCEGIVNLLREKGYQLTPVLSANRLAPEAHSYVKKEFPWVEVSSPDSAFAVSMPDAPHDGPDRPQSIKARACIDRTGLVYSVETLPAYAGKDLQAIKNRLTTYLEGRAVLVEKPKRVSLGPIQAWEFRERANGRYLRRLIAEYKGRLVALFVMGELLEDVLQPDADRYFNSLKVAIP